MALNIVFMATGEFALPSFRALVESEHTVSALVTQPDRVNPRGKVHPHPLKEFAESNAIPVFQPESINTSESVATLTAYAPDVVLVAAYGQILKKDVINVPRWGTFNLHGSLLPRHRGAAPVQYAIWKGDKVSGVTVFRIEPKLDAGPMIVKLETPIGARETSGQLHDRLAALGAEAVLKSLELLETETAQPEDQDPSRVTLSPKIQKGAGAIDWSKSMSEIDCHIRAMQPWPNPFTFLHRQGAKPERMLILQVTPDHSLESTAQPGEIVSADTTRLLVTAGDGVLQIDTLQPAGKKPMDAEQFLRGRKLEPGDYFGAE